MWVFVTSKGQRIAVRELPAVLGSSREADVVIPHESVAERHAQLSEDDDGGLLVDAIDGALIEVDGWQVAQTGLSSGGEIVIGRIPFTVERRDEGAEEPTRLRASSGPAAPADTAGGKPRGRAQAKARPPAGGRGPGPAAAPAPRRDDLLQRQRGILVARKNERDGWLHTDLSSLSGGARLVVALALVALAAGLWWVIQFAVTSAL